MRTGSAEYGVYTGSELRSLLRHRQRPGKRSGGLVDAGGEGCATRADFQVGIAQGSGIGLRIRDAVTLDLPHQRLRGGPRNRRVRKARELRVTVLSGLANDDCATSRQPDLHSGEQHSAQRLELNI